MKEDRTVAFLDICQLKYVSYMLYIYYFILNMYCFSGPSRVGIPPYQTRRDVPYQRKGEALLGSASLSYTPGHGV